MRERGRRNAVNKDDFNIVFVFIVGSVFLLSVKLEVAGKQHRCMDR